MRNRLAAILAALGLTLAALVATVAAAPSASAAGCAGNVVISNYDNYNYGDGTWQIRANATIQRCTTTTGDRYSKVNGYNVVISRLSEGCGGGTVGTFGHPITGWRVNPDQLGAWEPALHEVDSCNPGTIAFGPGGAVVWGSASYNIRCIEGSIVPKVNAWPDGAFSTDVPILCVV